MFWFWLDAISATLSLLCTLGFIQIYRKAWLIGFVTYILKTILFWHNGLYGHVIKYAIYFTIGIYGWHNWNQKKQLSTPIRYLTFKESLSLAIGASALIGLLGTALTYWTPSIVPYRDATSTVLAIVAHSLLSLRIINCWLIWLGVNSLTAILQWQQGLPFNSLLHWIYLGMAVLGYWRWHKLYAQQPYSLPISV